MKKILTPVICMLLAAGLAQAQTLENFDSGNLNNWTIQEGSPQVSSDEVYAGSGALRMAAFPDGATLLTHNTFSGAFGRYRVHFTCEGTVPDFHFFFQYQGPEDFYQVSCKPEGTDNPELRLIRQLGGEEEVVGLTGASFVTGQWNELVVERSCDLGIRIFINGVEQISVADDGIQGAGTVALGAWAETVYADELSFEPFQAEVKILGDTVFCYDPILLEASGIFENYQWSTGSSAKRASVDQEGLVWLEVTDENGCKGRDSARVVSFCPTRFFAPNIFSPNSDGVNDAFRLFTQQPPQQFVLQVFNRWGELVFESGDVEQGWDGMFRGKAAPVDMYLWAAEMDGFTLSGTVNLVR